MKSTLASFLFFLLFFINKPYAFAQERLDSLSHYSKVALHPQKYNDLINAYDYFNTIYSKNKDHGRAEVSINSLYYIASIAYKLGDYEQSEISIVEAISLLDTLPHSTFSMQTRRSLNVLMGLIYIEQRNEPKALEFYSKALKKAENPLDSAKVYNNISLVYKAFNDFENAKQELEKAFKLLPRINDTVTHAKILDNLGVAEYELNNNAGLDLMQRALELRIAQNDTSTIYTSYAHLSDYYNKINHIEAAKTYALKAYTLAKIINSPSYKEDALGLLTRLSDDPYAQQYIRLNDSLDNVEQQIKNKFALMKYDASEANRKALEAELENTNLKNTRLLTILLVIFIIVAALLLYYLQKTNFKKEKLREVFETESKISKRIHDEIANNLFEVMTKLDHNVTIDTSVIKSLDELYYKTRDISQEHSILNLEYDFVDNLETLIDSFNDTNTNIIIKGISEISWDTIPEINKITIYKVLQELLINMKKHSQATLVVFVFKENNKKIQINYSDNGIGCQLIRGSGLMNTENRIKAINGTITFETETNKGFKAKISV